MNNLFAPGCALLIERPHLAERMLDVLKKTAPETAVHATCCRHAPRFAQPTRIVNTCPGCDRRYRELGGAVTTVSFWEVLAASDSFAFPDYRGQQMSILDACPTRDQAHVQRAVRTLLEKMNITLIEPQRTGAASVCCGDSFFGVLPTEDVKERMRSRAAQMPAEEVVVYCVSCVKSMRIGGKRPRHLVDLLFGEETRPGTCEPEAWHAELDAFIAAHAAPGFRSDGP